MRRWTTAPKRLVVAIALAVVATPGAVALIPLQVEIQARQVSPGEPIRVNILTPTPLSSASGTFAGRRISLSRVPQVTPEQWSGWTVIPLDEAAGMDVVEVSGVDRDGELAAGTLAVEIIDKFFPEEQLTVPPSYVEPPPAARERIARERERLRGIYDMRTEPGAPWARFAAPVPGRPTSEFGTRRIFNGQPRAPHSGLDLRAAEGDPVYASAPGHVVLAGSLYYAGNTVILDHGGGLFTIYAHLSDIAVNEGDTVTQNQHVGNSGSTGRVTGPHLHWGAKIGSIPFDPRALLSPTLF